MTDDDKSVLDVFREIKRDLCQPTMTPEQADEAQDWKGMDGATAYFLIERHADNWTEAGLMMEAWRNANSDAAFAAGVREGRERAARYVEAERDRVLALQDGCIPEVDQQLRTTAALLPDIAAAIRAIDTSPERVDKTANRVHVAQQGEPDWSDSETGPLEVWKIRSHSMADRLLMADGAVAHWRKVAAQRAAVPLTPMSDDMARHIAAQSYNCRDAIRRAESYHGITMKGESDGQGN